MNVNRCPAQNEAKAQCWRDRGHEDDHKAYGDPKAPPMTWPQVKSRARMPKMREWYATLAREFGAKAAQWAPANPGKAAQVAEYARALQAMADEPDRRGGRRAARFVNGKAGQA